MKEKVIRTILALCFLASGLLKIVSLRSFEQEVQLYGEAYIGRWVSDYSSLIAISVCVTEIAIAVLALFGRFASYTSLAFLVMLLFFVYLTGMNLFFPSPVGSIESCGCFGELIHFTPVSAFIKSFALCVIALINVRWSIELPFKKNKIMRILDLTKLFVLALCVISCQASHEFSVNIGDGDKSISQSKYFEFKSLIALGGGESKESIIRKVDRVLLLNDRIVVSDVVGNHVLLFDSNGNFLASTDAMIGKGNNEYVHVQDCAVDTERQLIYMYCDRPYQFYVFDSNLKLLSCIKIKDYISEITMDEKNLYAYCVKDDNTSYELRMYDKKKLDGSYKTLLKYNEGIRGVRGMGRVLCGSDDHIGFAMPFNNVIYKIGQGEVKNSISIELKDWFTYGDSKRLSGRSFISSNKGKKWIIQNIHYSDSIMFFNTNEAPFCMVNMKNGSGDSYKYFTDAYIPYSVSWFTPCSSKQGWIVLEMSVEGIRNYIKYSNEKKKELPDAIKQLKIEDSAVNPILQFLQFRK